MLAVAMTLLVLFVLSGAGIAFVAGGSALGALWLTGQSAFVNFFPARFMSQIDSFLLMALPLFVLCGEIMNRAGVTRALIDLAMALLWRAKGALGHVNILASVFFAGISGSAMADAAALSKTLVPEMVERGYDRAYAGAITAASSIIGPIVPPSIIIIIYAALFEQSVAAMFAAGIVPGLLIALALIGVNGFYARRHAHPGGDAGGRLPLGRTFFRALPALSLPAIILGGIVFGIVTPTEAAALAVAAALGCAGFYGGMSRHDLFDALAATARISGTIFVVIGALSMYGWLLAMMRVPDMLAAWISGFGLGATGISLVIFVVFLLLGMVLDMQTCLFLVAPLLIPVAIAQGVDPIHIGIVSVVNFVIGAVSPPVGGLLVVTGGIIGEQYGRLCRAVMPFVIAEVLVLLLLVLAPEITLFLPRTLGYLE